MKISERGKLIPASPIRKLVPFAEKAKAAGVVVHHLNIGQPDVPTPPEFFDAIASYSGGDFGASGGGAKGKNKGKERPASGGARDRAPVVLGYGHSAGLFELREAMAGYYRRFGYDVAADDVTVTTGGSEAILFALTAVCDPGDEVVCFDPLYTNYNGFGAQMSVRMVPVRCRPEDNYHLPPRAEVAAAITPKTRALLACTPNNPTGAVLTRAEMQMLVDLARERDLFLIVDEAYREFIYGEVPHTSVLAFPEIAERAVLIDSLSKRFSLCGGRVGCLVTKNRDLGRVFLQLGQARLCPPALEQAGAVSFFRLGPDYFAEVQREYKRRRDAVVAGLNDIPGAKARTPEGAFYVMARLPVRDAEQFATWLLTDFRYEGETVMVAPGDGFYATPGLGKDEIRIAYVLEVERLERAMSCLKAALASYPERVGSFASGVVRMGREIEAP